MTEFSTIWPVITLFLGAAGTLGRDIVTQASRDRREEAVRQREFAKEAVERREEFELEHLVEINSLLRAQSDAVLELAVALRAHRYAQTTGDDVPYPHEALNRVQAADAAVWAKAGLILAEPARAWVQAAHESARATAATVQAGDREPELRVMGEKLNGAYAAVSARVREIYVGREAALR
ncbi:hypothetical protein OG552_35720 [Streptomyces sp. NBC_01476]|uniref:hypothetical protein n=1 Tax=Streptomyces sp. NBC_01476 TaxID=2903881 RepID=UPI002E328A0B|nr:hypothetical protein [Streptomyces sp. NBC_01476]